MTEVFDQEAGRSRQGGRPYDQGGFFPGAMPSAPTAADGRELARKFGPVRRIQKPAEEPRQPSRWPVLDEGKDWTVGELMDAEDAAGRKLPAPDPDPKKFATAAEHTEAFVEQRNHEHRMQQLWRNIQGAVYLSECGVSQTGIDQYLAGNKAKNASELRQLQWRFDAWTQRNYWDVILVIVALFTVVGFGVVAAHAEINEDSAFGFIAFLLGIGGMTAEVIRRGRE